MNSDSAASKTAPEGRGVFPSPHTAPRIPGYELLREIGSGSYGQVWLARNVLGTHRAVKVVYRSSFSNDRPYEREFRGLRNFEPIANSHPAFVNILHVGRDDHAGFFFYVMELADDASAGLSMPETGEKKEGQIGKSPAEQAIQPENSNLKFQVPSSTSQISHPKTETSDPAAHVPKTLAKKLQLCGRLPVGECLELGLALAGALGHLHKHRLVHRDIKPSNIIFVDGAPKLADIGLVVQLEQSLGGGSPGYIPPEGPGTPRGDIFSLGKVMYEMCTGKDRLDFPELPTDLDKMCDGPKLVKLCGVLATACENDAQERYQTAQEFHADLLALQGGKFTNTPRSLLSQGTRSRRGVFFAAAASVACAGILALWVAGRPKASNGSNTTAPLPGLAVLPSSAAQLSASEALKVAYTSQAPATAPIAARPQFQFEILARPEAQTNLVPIQDGASLRSEVDEYLFLVQPLTTGYLYIFQVDTAGNKDWVFPQNNDNLHSSGINPVVPKQTIQVPSPIDGQGRVFHLDRNTGIEHVYAVFSAARWPELEEALAKPPPPSRSPEIQLARRIQEPLGLRVRGLGGIRTNAAAVDLKAWPGLAAALGPMPSPTYEARETVLVIERWFRHLE